MRLVIFDVRGEVMRSLENKFDVGGEAKRSPED